MNQCLQVMSSNLSPLVVLKVAEPLRIPEMAHQLFWYNSCLCDIGSEAWRAASILIATTVNHLPCFVYKQGQMLILPVPGRENVPLRQQRNSF